jgi:hypothetical protein
LEYNQPALHIKQASKRGGITSIGIDEPNPVPFIFKQTTRAEDDAMYLGTGLGQPKKPGDTRPGRTPPKTPAKPQDLFVDVVTRWELEVPFRKDFDDFYQEVRKAIRRHVGQSDIEKVGTLLIDPGTLDLIQNAHTNLSKTTAESKPIRVKVSLGFSHPKHRGLKSVSVAF